jgi:hypothetical protein
MRVGNIPEKSPIDADCLPSLSGSGEFRRLRIDAEHNLNLLWR